MIRTWGGLAGQGGRVGPCPVCNAGAARRFLRDYFRETWGRDLVWIDLESKGPLQALVANSGTLERRKINARHE